MLFVYGLIVGALVGVFTMGLVAASRDFDRDSSETEIPKVNVVASDDEINTLSDKVDK